MAKIGLFLRPWPRLFDGQSLRVHLSEFLFLSSNLPDYQYNYENEHDRRKNLCTNPKFRPVFKAQPKHEERKYHRYHHNCMVNDPRQVFSFGFLVVVHRFSFLLGCLGLSCFRGLDLRSYVLVICESFPHWRIERSPVRICSLQLVGLLF